LTIVTSFRMHGISFPGIATRRCADGVSPSGVSTADDRRRLAVPPIIGHVSPRRTAAEDAGRFAGRSAAFCIGFADHGLEAHATVGRPR
jgi:hypothetical protein